MEGAGVEGVEIRLLQDDVEIDSTFSNEEGYYIFANLAPGSYKLAIDVNGAVQILEAFAISNLTDGQGGSATGATIDLGQDTSTMVSVELTQNCMGEMVNFGFVVQPTAVTMGDISATLVSEEEWRSSGKLVLKCRT